LKAWPIAAVCGALVALLAIQSPAAAQEELRIARVSRPAGIAADVVVSVPRVLSGRTLAANSFSVTIDGNPVTTTVAREVGAGFDLALVIDTSTRGTEELFLAAKAAAVEFILQQPPGGRVALFTSDPPAVALPFTADHSALVNAIRTMSRAPGDGLANALGLAARPNESSRPVTVIAAATSAESMVPTTTQRDALAESLRAGPSQLFTVGALSAPLAQLASDSGGFARAADARQFVGAFDAVAADIAGRYRLTFPVPANASRLDIGVTAPEGSAAASYTLSSAAPTTAGTAGTGTTGTAPAGTAPTAVDGIGVARSAGDSNDSSRTIAIMVAAGFVAVGLVVLFFVLRARRRRGPPLALVLAPYEPVAVPSAPSLSAPPSSSAPPPESSPPPPRSTAPIIDLRPPPAPSVLTGYSLTALCGDADVAELRAALEPFGIVVAQAQSAGDALRAVVTGRARALYVDASLTQARDLVAAVRQRNDAGWSACPTLLHDSGKGPPDPALMAAADAFIPAPIEASRVVAALAVRTPITAPSTR